MIRSIVKPDKAVISLEIPEDFIGKEIEVIAFETGENHNSLRKHVSFDAVSIDTRGFVFNRDEANG